MTSRLIFVFVIFCFYISIPELREVFATNPSTPAPSPGSGPPPGPASHSPSPSPSSENDDYYTLTTAGADLQKILPQDNEDAKTIKHALDTDDGSKEEIIANILSRRDPARRIVINKALKRDGHPLIDELYVPQNPDNTFFMDACFGLVNEEAVVTSVYISNALQIKDETLTIISMVLTKDRANMIQTFDSEYEECFKKCREDQRHPFENMLRVWTEKNREGDACGPVDEENVKKDADVLLKERCKWNDKFNNKRDQLELILMVKSINYARAVIKEFENRSENALLEDIINHTIKNKDLADAYSSLTRYIKNRHQYIADLMHTYNSNEYNYAPWIMAASTVRPQEWPKISAAYKSTYGQDLSQDVGACTDVRFAAFHEMLAIIIDPKYKAEMILANLPSNNAPTGQQNTHNQHH